MVTEKNKFNVKFQIMLLLLTISISQVLSRTVESTESPTLQSDDNSNSQFSESLSSSTLSTTKLNNYKNQIPIKSNELQIELKIDDDDDDKNRPSITGDSGNDLGKYH